MKIWCDKCGKRVDFHPHSIQRGKQRFACKTCNSTLTEGTRKNLPDYYRIKFFLLRSEGISHWKIGKMLNVDDHTVKKWCESIADVPVLLLPRLIRRPFDQKLIQTLAEKLQQYLSLRHVERLTSRALRKEILIRKGRVVQFEYLDNPDLSNQMGRTVSMIQKRSYGIHLLDRSIDSLEWMNFSSTAFYPDRNIKELRLCQLYIFGASIKDLKIFYSPTIVFEKLANITLSTLLQANSRSYEFKTAPPPKEKIAHFESVKFLSDSGEWIARLIRS